MYCAMSLYRSDDRWSLFTPRNANTAVQGRYQLLLTTDKPLCHTWNAEQVVQSSQSVHSNQRHSAQAYGSRMPRSMRPEAKQLLIEGKRRCRSQDLSQPKVGNIPEKLLKIRPHDDGSYCKPLVGVPHLFPSPLASFQPSTSNVMNLLAPYCFNRRARYGSS